MSFTCFVIPGLPQAEPGSRRQDAGANIGAVDGLKGEPPMRRVIHFDPVDSCKVKMDSGSPLRRPKRFTTAKLVNDGAGGASG
jgi:hypothetical protein